MSGAEITTDILARIDRLPWSRFHLLVVVALGMTWVRDRLDVTITGSISEIERKVGGSLPNADKLLKVHPRKVFGFGLTLGAMAGRR